MQFDWLLCLLSQVWEGVAGRLSEQKQTIQLFRLFKKSFIAEFGK